MSRILTVSISGLVLLLSACVSYSVYKEGVQNAGDLLIQAEKEIDEERFQSAVALLEQAEKNTTDASGGTNGWHEYETRIERLVDRRNLLLLEAYAALGDLESTAKIAPVVGLKSEIQFEQIVQEVLRKSLSGNDEQALQEARQLLYPMLSLKELEAQVSGQLSEEFKQGYFGGGNASVHLPPEWADRENPNSQLFIVLTLTVLRHNPGSSDAIRTLNSTKYNSTVGTSYYYGETGEGLRRCVATVAKQIANGSFTSTDLPTAMQFVSRHEER